MVLWCVFLCVGMVLCCVCLCVGMVLWCGVVWWGFPWRLEIGGSGQGGRGKNVSHKTRPKQNKRYTHTHVHAYTRVRACVFGVRTHVKQGEAVQGDRVGEIVQHEEQRLFFGLLFCVCVRGGERGLSGDLFFGVVVVVVVGLEWGCEDGRVVRERDGVGRFSSLTGLRPLPQTYTLFNQSNNTIHTFPHTHNTHPHTHKTPTWYVRDSYCPLASITSVAQAVASFTPTNWSVPFFFSRFVCMCVFNLGGSVLGVGGWF